MPRAILAFSGKGCISCGALWSQLKHHSGAARAAGESSAVEIALVIEDQAATGAGAVSAGETVQHRVRFPFGIVSIFWTLLFLLTRCDWQRRIRSIFLPY